MYAEDRKGPKSVIKQAEFVSQEPIANYTPIRPIMNNIHLRYKLTAEDNVMKQAVSRANRN